jgi:hypothetical protein
MGITDNTAGVSFEGTATILFLHFLKLAKQVLARVKKRQKAAARRNITAESKDLLEVYVLVAASLEAFINDFCQHKIDEIKWTDGKAYWLKGLEEIIDQKIEIRLKWRLVPQLLWQKAFDESQSPWQDFNVLMYLRNWLLHYKMEYLPPGKVPGPLGHIKHLLSSESQYTKEPYTLTEALKGSETLIDRICNLEMAQWAFNTGVKMIEKFLEFADQESRDNYAWLLPGFGVTLIADDTRSKRKAT